MLNHRNIELIELKTRIQPKNQNIFLGATEYIVEVARLRLRGLGPGVTELPSTPKIKQQSSITNLHSETGHFHIKSMPKCGKIGAASTAGWGAGAAIFSPVGRVVLLQKGGSPPQTPPHFLR